MDGRRVLGGAILMGNLKEDFYEIKSVKRSWWTAAKLNIGSMAHKIGRETVRIYGNRKKEVALMGILGIAFLHMGCQAVEPFYELETSRNQCYEDEGDVRFYRVCSFALLSVGAIAPLVEAYYPQYTMPRFDKE